MCGSRDFDDLAAVQSELPVRPALDGAPATIVHGAARGADTLAGKIARAYPELFVEEAHPAEWDKHGKRAGILRNLEIVKLGADLCIAFWDGGSPGTGHMIGACARNGIPVRVVPWRPRA